MEVIGLFVVQWMFTTAGPGSSRLYYSSLFLIFNCLSLSLLKKLMWSWVLETIALCSICLNSVSIHCIPARGFAKLRCGHVFHLACVGAAFNALGRMVCPNCRNEEESEWLYARGPHNAKVNLLDNILRWFKSTSARGFAKLRCGHVFNLAYIGAEFNEIKSMVCPKSNCRKAEGSKWLYASGPHNAQVNPLDNMMRWVNRDPESFWQQPASESRLRRTATTASESGLRRRAYNSRDPDTAY